MPRGAPSGRRIHCVPERRPICLRTSASQLILSRWPRAETAVVYTHERSFAAVRRVKRVLAYSRRCSDALIAVTGLDVVPLATTTST